MTLADCLKLLHSKTKPEFHLPDEVVDRLDREHEKRMARLLKKGLSEAKANRQAAKALVQEHLNATREDLAKVTSAIEAGKPKADAEPAKPEAVGAESSDQPALRIAKAGKRFKIINAADEQVGRRTYETEANARNALGKIGRKSTFGIPPSASGNDIIDAIIEQGGINFSGFSKEEAESMFPHRGAWRIALSTDNKSLSPDEVARLIGPSEENAQQGIQSFGDGDLRTMFDLVTEAIKARSSLRDQGKKQVTEQKALEKQARSFERAVLTPQEGQTGTAVSDLKVGDEVTAHGERLIVTDIDPDTGNVTMKDGSKWDVQIVEDGKVVYGEMTESQTDVLSDWPEIDTTDTPEEYAVKEGLLNESDRTDRPSGEEPLAPDAERQGSAEQPASEAGRIAAAPEKVAEPPLEKARRVLAAREAEQVEAREEGDYELAASLARVLPKLRRDLAEAEKAANAAPAQEPAKAEPVELWQRTRDQVGGNLLGHREAVKAAVKAGLPVPDEVLAEYSAYTWAEPEIKRRRREQRKAEKEIAKRRKAEKKASVAKSEPKNQPVPMPEDTRAASKSGQPSPSGQEAREGDSPLPPKSRWYRGTNNEREYKTGDKFYSFSKEAAEEYAASWKFGKAGEVKSVLGSELPKRLLAVYDKEQLARDLKIKGNPYADGFDGKIKAILQARGFEGVRYQGGTWGAEEIHVFANPESRAPSGGAPKLAEGQNEAATPAWKPGDEVTFTPSKPRGTSVTGIVQDIVRGTTGTVGYNIFSPKPLDPTRVVRVWEEDGTVTAAQGQIPISEKSEAVATPPPATASPIGDLLAADTTNTGKTANVTNEDAGTLVRVGGQVVAKLNQAKDGVFHVELNAQGNTLNSEQKAAVEQSANDYTKTWRAAKLREGVRKPKTAADLTTQLDMLEQGRSDTPLFEQKASPSTDAGKYIQKTTVFHGTDQPPFETFDPSKIGSGQGYKSQVPGFWFTTNKDIAPAFGKNTITAKLDIRNPFEIGAREYLQKFSYNGEDPAAFRADLEARGFDGLLIRAEPEYADNRGPSGTIEWGVDNFVAFKPEQVNVAKPDSFEAFLDKTIEGLKPNSGQLFSDPLFIQSVGKPVLRAALQVVRAAYKGGKAMAAAIEEGMAYLRANVKDLDEAGAKKFFDQLRDEAPAEAAPEAAKTEPAQPPPLPPAAEPAPEAPLPSSGPTALFEDAVNADRAARGLEPVGKDEPITNEDILERGRAMLAANPNLGREIAERLRSGTAGDRSISREDAAVLAAYKRSVVTARDAAGDILNDPKSTPEQKAIARTDWDAGEARVKELDQAAQDARSVWGGWGQFWQRQLREDFSFEALQRKARVAKDGPLSRGEVETIRKQAERIAELEKAAEEAAAAKADAEEMQGVKDTIKKTVDELAKAAKAAKKVGAGIVEFFNDQEAKARARIIARRGKLFATIDPLNVAGLVDEAIIGSAHIGRGLTKFADWSAKMLSDFGDRIRPVLKDLFDVSKSLHDSSVEGYKKAKGEAKPSDVLAKAKANATAGEELDHRTVYELARAHINAGIHGEGPVMAAVHADLLPLYPSLTERDVRRAFSEYGKVKFPSKEADKKELAELRTLTRLQESIDRMTEGRDALHSGLQREKATQAIREKQKQLNELLKKVATAPSAEKLASREEAKQTALRNAIADLDKQLRTGEKPVQGAPAPDSPATEQLKAERDAMKAKLAEIEAEENPGKTEAEKQIEALQKVRDRADEVLSGKRPANAPADWTPLSATAESLKAEIIAMSELSAQMRRDAKPKGDPGAAAEKSKIAALERAIERYRWKTEKNDFSVKGKTQGPDSRIVAGLKEVLASRKSMYAAAKAAGKPVLTAEQRYNATRAKAIAKQMAEIQARIAAGDYAPRPKKAPPALSKENEKARFELHRAKQQIAQGMFDEALKRRTKTEKARDTAFEVFHTIRAILTGGELSGVLRQGKFALASRPIVTAKGAIPAMFKAAWSPAKEHAEMEKIMSRDNAPLYKQSGLAIHDPNDFTSAQLEGNYRSRWANKIPLIAGSGRAYTVFLNRLRADVFDVLKSKFETREGSITPEELKNIAQFVNEQTGSGGLGIHGQKAVGLLNAIYFAPKFTMSRLQMLLGHSLWSKGSTWKTRRLIVEEYARIGAGLAVMYMLYNAFRDDDEPIEKDPRSSNFGKIKSGKSWIDPMAGEVQVATLLSRAATGETKQSDGDIESLVRDEDPVRFGARNMKDVLFDFNRSKMSPVAGMALDELLREDFRGEALTAKSRLSRLAPITYGQIYQTMTEEENVPKGAALSVLGFFGEGIRTDESR